MVYDPSYLTLLILGIKGLSRHDFIILLLAAEVLSSQSNRFLAHIDSGIRGLGGVGQLVRMASPYV
jgi:hypothetical protein